MLRMYDGPAKIPSDQNLPLAKEARLRSSCREASKRKKRIAENSPIFSQVVMQSVSPVTSSILDRGISSLRIRDAVPSNQPTYLSTYPRTITHYTSRHTSSPANPDKTPYRLPTAILSSTALRCCSCDSKTCRSGEFRTSLGTLRVWGGKGSYRVRKSSNEFPNAGKAVDRLERKALEQGGGSR